MMAPSVFVSAGRDDAAQDATGHTADDETGRAVVAAAVVAVIGAAVDAVVATEPAGLVAAVVAIIAGRVVATLTGFVAAVVVAAPGAWHGAIVVVAPDLVTPVAPVFLGVASVTGLRQGDDRLQGDGAGDERGNDGWNSRLFTVGLPSRGSALTLPTPIARTVPPWVWTSAREIRRRDRAPTPRGDAAEGRASAVSRSYQGGSVLSR